MSFIVFSIIDKENKPICKPKATFPKRKAALYIFNNTCYIKTVSAHCKAVV